MSSPSRDETTSRFASTLLRPKRRWETLSTRIELPPTAIGYVYRTDCAEHGWSYIGQSTQLDREHLDGYFGSGFSIQEAISEHGVAGLEKRLIAAADHEITLHYLEIVAIAEARKDGVTLLNGDFGGPRPFPLMQRALERTAERDGGSPRG